MIAVATVGARLSAQTIAPSGADMVASERRSNPPLVSNNPKNKTAEALVTFKVWTMLALLP